MSEGRDLSIYRKYVGYFTEQEIEQLKNRYRYFNKILGVLPEANSPKLIGSDKAHLIFEKVNLNPTLERCIFNKYSIHPEAWNNIGRALGALHSEDRKDISDLGNIWGDFSCKNMHINVDGRVTVFDAEPPADAKGKRFQEFCINSPYMDIGRFVFSLFTSHSMLYPWRLLEDRSVWIRNFLVAYERCTGWHVSRDQLFLYVSKIFHEWYVERKVHDGLLISSIKLLIIYGSLLLHRNFYKSFK